jgi:hypothetical protein
MRRFEVLKTPEGCAVRELPDELSRVTIPRKPSPTVNYTAQQLLDFMFTDGAESTFISGRVAEYEYGSQFWRRRQKYLRMWPRLAADSAQACPARQGRHLVHLRQNARKLERWLRLDRTID